MIEINNLTTVSVDKNLVKKVSEGILKEEKIKKEFNLSIALVGSEVIKKLNKKYRGKNRITDVLSFPELKTGTTEERIFKKDKNLGEIVICLGRVKKNAQKYNSNFKTEFIQVLIHGILHLLRYDHEESKKEAEKMEEKQKFYLSKFVK